MNKKKRQQSKQKFYLFINWFSYNLFKFSFWKFLECFETINCVWIRLCSETSILQVQLVFSIQLLVLVQRSWCFNVKGFYDNPLIGKSLQVSFKLCWLIKIELLWCYPKENLLQFFCIQCNNYFLLFFKLIYSKETWRDFVSWQFFNSFICQICFNNII